MGLILLSQGGANVYGVADQSHSQISSTPPSETGGGGADISVINQSSELGTTMDVWSALVVGLALEQKKGCKFNMMKTEYWNSIAFLCVVDSKMFV